MEEDTSKMICVSNSDAFVLGQDACVMCGSMGNDLEGRLIVCTQCGQCYHPHCVSVRVSVKIQLTCVSRTFIKEQTLIQC